MSQVKTYEGSSIEEILPQIRAELGDDAIVVRQREGLKGGVGGFFQKRCVEVEAKAGSAAGAVAQDADVRRFPGQPVPMRERPLEEAPAIAAPSTPSIDVTDGPEATPEGFVPFTVSDYQAQAPQRSMTDIAAEMPSAPAFAEHLVQADAEHAEQEVAAGRPLTVEEILTGVVAPAAPVAAVPVVPAPRPTMATSPQVDAIAPAAEADAVEADAVETDEVETEAEQEVAAVAAPAPVVVAAPAPVAAPVPAAVPASVPAAAPSPAAAAPNRAVEKVTSVLVNRGLDTTFVESLVADVVAYRLPLVPNGRVGAAVARELAQRIPVDAVHRPGVTAWVGTAGSGKTMAIGTLARAYAAAGTLPVACVTIHSPDGGAALRIALQASGIEVFVARDEDESAALAGQLSASGRAVFVDTPALAPRSKAEVKSLAQRLQRVGATEVHLCVPATLSRAVASDLVAATASLNVTALAITHSDETDRLGAAVQLAIDTELPISYVASVDAEHGHVLRAADSSDLAKALVS